MFNRPKLVSGLLSFIFIVLGPTTERAQAITVEVAKKCHALSAKAFPPRQIGNPAAGSAKGTGKDASEFFKRCVANGGDMDNDSSKIEYLGKASK